MSTAKTSTNTLPLHDALPISRNPSQDQVPMGDGGCRHDDRRRDRGGGGRAGPARAAGYHRGDRGTGRIRSEEHTSELQSLTNLVCRLLLEKKKKRHY